ncbi:MAG TPA: DUF3472 domain-containing protein [Verrucomicrobiae bacterium]
MAESDNILTKLQDLLVYVIPQLNKFPRDQKFVLGDRIENKLLDVQEDCLRAYYSRDKRGHLLEANLQLEVARHLVTFRTRTGGKSLHGYYSFIEDFRRDGRSVSEVRRARFGNGWVRSTKGEWISLRRATFTASSAEWEAKENIDAGTDAERFYLATGGSTGRPHELGKMIALPDGQSAQPPELPSLGKR